jgi:hypothetical protein
MKVIIAGTRTFDDYELLKKQLYYFLRNDSVEEVVSGACNIGVHTFTRPDGTRIYGADGLGERWAAEHYIPVKSFPADWDNHGLSAGPIRNKKMAEYLNPKTDKCAVFHDGTSKGSWSMAKIASKRKIKTEVVNYLIFKPTPPPHDLLKGNTPASPHPSR